MNDIVMTESIEQIATRIGSPYSISLELLTKCNFNCVHCYIPEHTKEMPMACVLNIIDQAKALGVFEIMFTGGEIFIRKDIIDIISYARKCGLRVILFSNISLLNESLVDALAEMHITEISTTVFSMNARLNDEITTRKGSLDSIMHAAELLKLKGITLEMKVPIMKMNQDDYLEIMKFCTENGYKFNYTTAITARTNGDKAPCDYLISQEKLNSVLFDLDRTSEAPVFNVAHTLCPAIGNSLHVDVDGNVSPCISFPFIYGNIYTNSLSEIWYEGRERQALLQMKKEILSECKQCELKDYCGRCPGLAYTEDKTLTGCSHLDKSIALARKECKFSI